MYNPSSGDEDKDDDDNNGLSLEGFCHVLILQNAIDSVILNDNPSGEGGGTGLLRVRIFLRGYLFVREYDRMEEV